jgi:hypothetical protein
MAAGVVSALLCLAAVVVLTWVSPDETPSRRVLICAAAAIGGVIALASLTDAVQTLVSSPDYLSGGTERAIDVFQRLASVALGATTVWLGASAITGDSRHAVRS